MLSSRSYHPPTPPSQLFNPTNSFIPPALGVLPLSNHDAHFFLQDPDALRLLLLRGPYPREDADEELDLLLFEHEIPGQFF